MLRETIGAVNMPIKQNEQGFLEEIKYGEYQSVMSSILSLSQFVPDRVSKSILAIDAFPVQVGINLQLACINQAVSVPLLS
jgi:hypothetical protein